MSSKNIEGKESKNCKYFGMNNEEENNLKIIRKTQIVVHNCNVKNQCDSS